MSMMSTIPCRAIGADLVAVLGERLEPDLARVRLGRLPRRADAEGHVGVLGVGEDELAAVRVGVDRRELAVERLFHQRPLPPWPEMVTREAPPPLPTPPEPIVTRTPLPFGARAAGGRAPPRLGGVRVRLEDLVDRLAEDLRRVLERRDLLRPERDLELRLDALAADDRRHRDADVADAVGAVHERGDRAGCASGRGRSRGSRRGSRSRRRTPPALELDHLGAAAPGLGEEGVGRR